MVEKLRARTINQSYNCKHKLLQKYCYLYPVGGRTSQNALRLVLFPGTMTSSKENSKLKQVIQVIDFMSFSTLRQPWCTTVMLAAEHTSPRSKPKIAHICPFIAGVTWLK